MTHYLSDVRCVSVTRGEAEIIPQLGHRTRAEPGIGLARIMRINIQFMAAWTIHIYYKCQELRITKCSIYFSLKQFCV